ncbi:LysR family transcriptional regulator [Pseudomonas poae]|uniref:LysR family transcriptional regulator n=1 Tax=Pseudomonas poae TaxID=200451 RepID=UPI0030D18CEC
MDRIQAMQVFVRVAEAGSFIQAAQTLSLPASTVTSSVKNLEKYLQVRLLNRTTRRVSLTSEGAQYLAQCREILELIEHTETSLTDSVNGHRGVCVSICRVALHTSSSCQTCKTSTGATRIST